MYQIEDKNGRKPATLVMHTDPYDQEGPNLDEISRKLGIEDNVLFSTQRVGFEEINIK